jgi:uncharacterized membrane protein YgdD (TMEM256/DUF423 family)
MKTEAWFAQIGAILAGLSVVGGAFGSHLLREKLSADFLSAFETGVRYQMYHALALIAIAWVHSRWPRVEIQIAGWCFVAGVALFCGSIYALVLSHHGWIGAVTPLGGLAFISGWALLFWGVWKNGGVR